MYAEASLNFTGELSVEHRRGGIIVGQAFSGPREPLALKAIRDPWYKRAVSQQMLRDLFDPGLRLARLLRRLGPHNLVTSAGAQYMASDFSGTGNITNFNYHDCGTGTLSGSLTSTINGATNASPIVIATSGAHGLTTNDLARIASVGGNTNANADWQLSVVDSTHFNLIGSSGNSAYTSGGSFQRINGAGDTTLVTAFGGSRVAGTQTNPSSTQYRTVATLSAASGFPLSIIEWGLFSASSGGTLWDRRYLNTMNAPNTTATGSLTSAPITLTSTSDTITFTYTLTVNAGGS
jgi:hypothetical protein